MTQSVLLPNAPVQELVTLPVGRLLADPRVLIRKVDPKHVTYLAGVFATRKGFNDPIMAMYVTSGAPVPELMSKRGEDGEWVGQPLITDGQHRYTAVIEAVGPEAINTTEIPVLVSEGTWNDAILAAATSNWEHGAVWSDNDRAEAILRLARYMKSPNDPAKAINAGEIALLLGISADYPRQVINAASLRSKAQIPADKLPLGVAKQIANVAGMEDVDKIKLAKRAVDEEWTPSMAERARKGFAKDPDFISRLDSGEVSVKPAPRTTAASEVEPPTHFKLATQGIMSLADGLKGYSPDAFKSECSPAVLASLAPHAQDIVRFLTTAFGQK